MKSLEKEERPWGRFYVLHNDSNFKIVWVYNNDEASSTAGQAGILMANNLSAYIAFDAEL